MAEIRLDNITKKFDGKEVVRSLEMNVKQGELVALLGQSGCGKTTTLRMIAGLLNPDGGEIYFDGEPTTHLKGQERGAVMVFQDYRLFPHMTVFENIAFGLKGQKKERKYIKERVKWALEMVKLSGYEKRYPSELSGGQSQRIALARALVLEPKVLLLDEPLSNLDAVLRDEMRCLIKSLHQSLNLTIIFVTHDQKEAIVMADRIAVMKDGIIEQFATPMDIYYRPANPWVATFVGQANLVAVTLTEEYVESIVGSWKRSEIKDEQWFVSFDKKDSELLVSFRPEDVQMRRKDQEIMHQTEGMHECGVNGKVVEYIFTGENCFYHVQVGSEIIVVSSSGQERINSGEIVTLRVNQHSVCVYGKY